MRSVVDARFSLLVLAFGALAWSFWFSAGWLQLCAGLALFLFGMQSLEQGLKSLAGGKLEDWLARSTATPAKGLLFGCVATLLLQSSTLVSLLTIAFLSTGLITLAASLTVLFGANLGATSGIWLLAMAGQNLSMAPLAMPLLVFGVLLGFTGDKGKAVGRLLLGIALIFMGIDAIKQGFDGFGDLNLQREAATGLQSVLLFTAIGMLVTVVVQSSHATLMLTLAALASQQLELTPALCIAIGSNVGSSISTAFMGMIGSSRSGQRLAIAHAVFNCSTAVLSLILLMPLTWGVVQLTTLFGMGGNALIQLALFHTVFNALGVAVFWPIRQPLVRALERWLPDAQEPKELIATPAAHAGQVSRARYLTPAALQTTDSATSALRQELQHLGRLGLEVVAHALYGPVSQWEAMPESDATLRQRVQQGGLDAEQLYQLHIKGVYADWLEFMGRMDQPLDEAEQTVWRDSQVAAFQLVEAVRDAQRLQKNLRRYLLEPEASVAHQSYLALRQHVLDCLRELRALGVSDMEEQAWSQRLQQLDTRIRDFEQQFRLSLFAHIRSSALNGMVASSLMNDLGYAQRITHDLRHVLLLGEGNEAERLRLAALGTDPLLADLV